MLKYMVTSSGLSLLGLDSGFFLSRIRFILYALLRFGYVGLLMPALLSSLHTPASRSFTLTRNLQVFVFVLARCDSCSIGGWFKAFFNKIHYIKHITDEQGNTQRRRRRSASYSKTNFSMISGENYHRIRVYEVFDDVVMYPGPTLFSLISFIYRSGELTQSWSCLNYAQIPSRKSPTAYHFSHILYMAWNTYIIAASSGISLSLTYSKTVLDSNPNHVWRNIPHRTCCDSLPAFIYSPEANTLRTMCKGHLHWRWCLWSASSIQAAKVFRKLQSCSLRKERRNSRDLVRE